MRAVTAACAVLAVLSLACGGPTGTPDGGGGGTGGSGGGAAGGAGGGTGGGAGGGGTGGATGNNLGFVAVSQVESGAGISRGASAAFYPSGPPTPLGVTCTTTTNLGCAIADCSSDGGVPTFDGGATVAAGTVTAGVGATSLALSRGTVTGVYTASGSGLWWTGGETVTAQATGDASGAPAFSSTLNAPTRLALTAPPPGAVPITRGTALTVSWVPGTGATEIALTSGNPLAGRTVKLTCPAAASAGTFTVAGALTQSLLTGAGSLQVTNRAEAVTSAGGWTIHTSASSTAPTRTITVQ